MSIQIEYAFNHGAKHHFPNINVVWMR